MPSPPASPIPCACPQCGTAGVRDLGPLPEARVFAGQPLVPPWPGGRLYACAPCGLGFRHPLQPSDAYARLYASAPAGVWTAPGLRPDQGLVKALVEAEADARSVLDVGCYDGRLLAALDPRLARHGVEASAEAAARARAVGVEIVAPRVEDLAHTSRRFDVVCAVDLIEHLPDPRGFVATLRDALSDGGLLVLSTGAFETAAWRLAGGAWWYAAFPEHIRFVSAAWARRTAADLGLELVATHRFAYAALPPERRLAGRLRFAGRLLRARLGRTGRHGPPPRSIGEPGLFDDHLLITFRRGGRRPAADRLA